MTKKFENLYDIWVIIQLIFSDPVLKILQKDNESDYIIYWKCILLQIYLLEFNIKNDITFRSPEYVYIFFIDLNV